jgi:hypothetical protein
MLACMHARILLLDKDCSELFSFVYAIFIDNRLPVELRQSQRAI